MIDSPSKIKKNDKNKSFDNKWHDNSANREIVMQSVFQLLTFIDDNLDYDSSEILYNMYGVEKYEDCPTFSQLLYATVLENFNQIKQIISDNLINWEYSRVAISTRAILFIAIAEGKFLTITPRKVVINEAIELAKNYCDSKDYKFVNGLLDKVV